MSFLIPVNIKFILHHHKKRKKFANFIKHILLLGKKQESFAWWELIQEEFLSSYHNNKSIEHLITCYISLPNNLFLGKIIHKVASHWVLRSREKDSLFEGRYDRKHFLLWLPKFFFCCTRSSRHSSVTEFPIQRQWGGGGGGREFKYEQPPSTSALSSPAFQPQLN